MCLFLQVLGSTQAAESWISCNWLVCVDTEERIKLSSLLQTEVWICVCVCWPDIEWKRFDIYFDFIDDTKEIWWQTTTSACKIILRVLTSWSGASALLSLQYFWGGFFPYLFHFQNNLLQTLTVNSEDDIRYLWNWCLPTDRAAKRNSDAKNINLLHLQEVIQDKNVNINECFSEKIIISRTYTPWHYRDINCWAAAIFIHVYFCCSCNSDKSEQASGKNWITLVHVPDLMSF